MGKVIAFIPVRGGSKSIPRKNIRLFCGKPLVYWTLKALDMTSEVDVIIVATDSDEIETVTLGFNFPKVSIYRRSEACSTDTASTESVVLEYLNYNQALPPDTLFLLVQATSPLTESRHFSEALARYCSGPFDSMLSCVRQFRFFWNEDGTPVNFEYRQRPRRQEFKGTLMENGAFYINTVANIRQSGNRLSGSIGLYEMPDYTSIEIDEPGDWTLLENLMRKHQPARIAGQSPSSVIKLVLTDVDGVLTDAGMYYSESGDELKKFNTRDGMAFELLHKAGIKTGIITSENTRMVERRALKLNVDHLFQGKRDGGKISDALRICEQEGLSMDEVAYIGDDVNDKDLLQAVGFSATPFDAPACIKELVSVVTQKAGGEGAFREFAEIILHTQDGYGLP